jgi:peptidoglycan/LPS O-acetylase OafA/YrhL
MELTLKQMARLPAALLLVAGAWLTIGPWVLPKPYPPQPAWNDVAVGLVLVLVALIKSAGPRLKWPAWVATILGLWILFAPWLLAYSPFASPLLNETITAMAILIVASAMILVTLALTSHD